MRALRASSGGILDLDDRVRDVADDRETLTAECANQAQPRAAQADGASGSSAGTASPDMFRVSNFYQHTFEEKKYWMLITLNICFILLLIFFI